MTPLAVTSLTNFVLAAEVFFLAGLLFAKPMARYSAAWYWSWMMFFLAVGSLLGGLDHEFFEPGNLPRFFIQRSTWIALGAMTFCLLMTTAREFFPQRLQRVARYVAIAQFVANTAVVLAFDRFLTVILNYAPILLLLLVLNLAKGAWPLTAGLLILAAASAIQGLHIDALSPLDHNGLYHVVAMVGVVFLYLGGRRLSAT